LIIVHTRNPILVTVSAAALLGLSGCSAATYDERMTYLRKVAQQGADTHQLLASQEGPVINGDRCGKAWDGLKNPGDFPSDIGGGGTTAAWQEQIRQFFVDSCVSGKPKSVPALPSSPAQTSTPGSSNVPTTPSRTG
jgi:hypothetical protein